MSSATRTTTRTTAIGGNGSRKRSAPDAGEASEAGEAGEAGDKARTAHDSDSDSPKESDDEFVHNPQPGDIVIVRCEKYWERHQRLEAAEEAREERRATVRERHAAAKRAAQREDYIAARVRAEGEAVFQVAQMAAKAAEWMAAGWKPPSQ
jgi:hypothetical protein